MVEVQDRAAGVAADLVASEVPAAAAAVEASGDLAVAVTLAAADQEAVGEESRSNGCEVAATRPSERTADTVCG
jgi:hypothetical protein